MGRKKRRRSRRRDVNIAPSPRFVPVWRQLYQSARRGERTEEERAVIAKRVAMMRAVRVFTKEMGMLLPECNTNLGLLLESVDAVSASMELHGTENLGVNEYVPVKMIIQFGEVQNLEDHIAFLENGWMVKKPGEEDVDAPSPSTLQENQCKSEHHGTTTL